MTKMFLENKVILLYWFADLDTIHFLFNTELPRHSPDDRHYLCYNNHYIYERFYTDGKHLL